MKQAHVMARSDHTLLWKFLYSVMKNDKAKKWSQKMNTIKPVVFELIKGKDNVLADSQSRLRHLGLHDDNDPEEPGQEYSKSIFKTDETITHCLDNDQNSDDKFKINGQGVYFGQA